MYPTVIMQAVAGKRGSDFDRALANTNFTTLGVSELIELDRNIRALAHQKNYEDCLQLHRAIHGRFHEWREAEVRGETPAQIVASRPFTLEESYTIWRECTCACENHAPNVTFRQQAREYLARRIWWDVRYHPRQADRTKAEKFLPQANLSLPELLELEAQEEFHDCTPSSGGLRRRVKHLGQDFRTRIKSYEASWEYWLDVSWSFPWGTWQAELCKKRLIEDLVGDDAPFEQWLERLLAVCTFERSLPLYKDQPPTYLKIDQRDYRVRVLLAGLERKAETFAHWNRLHELTAPSKLGTRIEARLFNLLLQG